MQGGIPLSLTAVILMMMTFLVNFVMHLAFWWIMYQIAILFPGMQPYLPATDPGTFLVKLSCLSILIPAVVFSVGPMQRVLVWSNGGRKAQGLEREKVERALETVCRLAHLRASDYELYVSANQDLNAFALGNRYITATRGLLQYMDDGELAGILAHEVGHLQKGHTRAGLFICGMSWFGDVIVQVYALMNFLCRLVLWIPIFGWFVAFIMFLINLQHAFFIYLLAIPANFLTLCGQRQEEYEADHYACAIGLGAELKKGLQDLEAFYGERKLGFFECLRSDHPDTGKRIERIEKWLAVSGRQ